MPVIFDEPVPLLCNKFTAWLLSNRREDVTLPDGPYIELSYGLLQAEAHKDDFPGVVDYWERSWSADSEERERYCELKFTLSDHIDDAIGPALEAAGFDVFDDDEVFEGASARLIWATIAGPAIEAIRELEDAIASGDIRPPMLDPSEVELTGPGPRASGGQ